MSRVVFSPLAEEDLTEILDYIAEDSPANAIHFVQTIRDKCDLLASQPGLGRRRPEFRGGRYRSFTVGHYLIFYEPSERGIQIARVQHGARDLEPLL